jgi:molecular chaperone GrpE
MALPEDEAKQTSESGEETFEEQPLKQEAGDEDALEQIEADNGDGPSDQQGADDELELLDSEVLANALSEVEKFRDMALRAEAEMQNLQRRTARDVENAHKFGVEKFVQNMLPVVDSLEKAIESIGENVDAIAEGVRLCHKLMVDTLNKEGVEITDPVGEPFDPNEHQAMSMVENPDMEPNSVLAVVQKGCKLNGRLVRPAMVMVSKAPAKDVPTDSAPEAKE